MKDKPEQLPSPQQLSGPKVLQGHLQYKISQLVWGLFFLHSDSLVATIRCYSPQIVAQGAPCPTNQQKAQLLIPTSIQCLARDLLRKEQESQRDLPCVVKKPQEAFSQLTPDSEAFQDHESVSLLPGDFFIPELQEQLEEHLQQRFTQHCCGLSPRPHVSPDLIQPQDLQQRFTPHCCGLSPRNHVSPDLIQRQDLQQRFTPHCCGLSPRPHLSPDLIQRQDLQQRFTPHCCGLSPRPHLSPDLIQPQDLQHRFTQQCCRLSARPHMSPDLIQPQDEFPGISQVKDRHGPSVFIGGSSQNMEKMEFRGPAKFQLGEIPSNDPKHSLRRVLEDLPRALESNSRKVPGANTEKKSERDWMRLLGSDSGKDSPRSPEMKHLEDIVEVHLHRKLGEINKGMFPEDVHRPSLTNGHLLSLENSNIHMESGNLAPSEGEESNVNTSQQLSFLDVHTRQVLEVHIKRFQESHERRQTLKVHKPPHLLKVQKAQPLSLSQPAFLSSATRDSDAKSIAEAANAPGEPPHQDPGDKVAAKTSVSIQRSPQPGPLPVCKGAQRSAYKTETPSGDNILSTQASLSSFQSMSSSNTSAFQGACDFLSREQSSQGQEEPRSPKFQNLRKSLSKMFGPIGRREGRRRLTQGRHEQMLTGLSPSAQDTESVESLSSQSSRLLPEKGQASPESHFKKRIRCFLHWIVPSEKSKGHKDPLQKVKPAPAAAWSRGPVPNGLFVDNGKAEAQALMTTPQWEGVPATTGVLPTPEQRAVMRSMAYSHHATPVGHSHPVKHRDGDSSWASLPREHVSPASPCQHRPLLLQGHRPGKATFVSEGQARDDHFQWSI
ncbi:PREDICTED: spermatogenesis-associated protein 31C2-like [Galeopterus variegatus]|uniref:Spermatogenesis-associated protein 31C2-like n=1 Tax=Galeopterus variegatus TaxID=482537 RepID=A0ABM0SAB4_GALVR|nr:PREDICTED: spermatogenesis-associated protein 31C2-like [Galeopterus variegatus]